MKNQHNTTGQADAFMQWNATLRWSHQHECWIALTEQETIYVPDEVYHAVLKDYLFEKYCIEMKTFTEYMRPGEEGWRAQCEATNRLLANTE